MSTLVLLYADLLLFLAFISCIGCMLMFGGEGDVDCEGCGLWSVLYRFWNTSAHYSGCEDKGILRKKYAGALNSRMLSLSLDNTAPDDP